MCIRKYSQQLDRLLKGLTKGNERQLLEESFGNALSLGGLAERDFLRERGVSYNPRPARVVHILVHDCGTTNAEVLAAAMIASVCEAQARDKDNSLPEAVIELAAASKQSVGALGAVPLEAQQIAVAVRLDRARHFHLSRPSIETLSRFVDETELFIPLAEKAAPRVSMLLHAWIERARSQIA